ncbi:uncharacterized protein METZ01_LOCUS299987, partial [marine metagenome]
RSVADLRSRLNAFAKAFEGRRVSAVDEQEVRNWLDGMNRLSARSLKNYRNAVCGFFNWAVARKYRPGNPVAAIPVPKIDWKPPCILTVAETNRLLRAALEVEGNYGRKLLACHALALFAGIRTQEVTQLNWSAVNLDRKLVRIDATIAKKRRLRTVDLPDNCVAWLRLCAEKEGRVSPPKYYKRVAEFRRDAGFTDWKDEKSNALRHSFGSYHFALYQNAPLTSSLLGHRGDDDVLFDHYRALCDKKDAEAYFAITPKNVGRKK